MEINWQNVFYITASLTMVAVFVTCIWLIWFSFFTLKLIKNLVTAVRAGSNLLGEIEFFRKSIKSKVLSFLLKILEKGGKNEQQ